ncbi:hypothetical protein RRG08_037607 [Elysia crispata]|uniref:Uncharacterized protein n=1 Tax=Elysia crispata TaxID=231223 RepID=A0AAE1CZ41_9GAST|nr:hypothetical protein RRG08_037607 [Elysia crispata]
MWHRSCYPVLQVRGVHHKPEVVSHHATSEGPLEQLFQTHSWTGQVYIRALQPFTNLAVLEDMEVVVNFS